MSYSKIKAWLIFALLVIIFQPAEPAFALVRRQPYLVETKTAVLSLEKTPDTAAGNYNINVDPGGESINAVGAVILFDPAALEIASIDIENSFCIFFIENEFNNQTGEIKISCGLPFPGIKEPAEIARIELRKKSSAPSQLIFSPDSQVLANNGYGTDILKDTIDLLIQ